MTNKTDALRNRLWLVVRHWIAAGYAVEMTAHTQVAKFYRGTQLVATLNVSSTPKLNLGIGYQTTGKQDVSRLTSLTIAERIFRRLSA